jgi:uncharacterized protein (TIGR02453 family)
MAFSGWPVEAIEFFEGLEADNSKIYWTANKTIYDECVYAPMALLLAELAAEFGEGRVYRPYRDVRFSKDKSPYKTTISASLARGGYLQLSATGFGAGNGMWMMAPDQLDRYRKAVSDDATGSELERVIARVERKGTTVSGHDALKTAPKGYPKDHPRIGLLRNKGLVCWQDWPVGPELGTVKVKRDVVAFLRSSQPLNDWLAAHVGETAMEIGR